MKLWEKQAIFAQNVALLLQFIHSKGYHATFGEAFRTAEQAKLNAQKGIGTVDSLHCQRLAIDLNLINDEGIYLPDSHDYALFGSYWKSLDKANVWGGDWRPSPLHPHQNVDGNHFQMVP